LFSHFFAVLSRMKYINRWGLMRNTRPESLSEHALEVAVLAQALALIANRYFGASLDSDRAAVLGLYHDISEILTGDLPTPVKYANDEMRAAYKAIERQAGERLLALLPAELRGDYGARMEPAGPDEALRPYIKAADKLSAVIKCTEERRQGNREFDSALRTTTAAVHALELPAAEYFMRVFLPSYGLTLDEQGSGIQKPETII